MPEVVIDGQAYVPASDLENLKRWYGDALVRIGHLEADMAATIKMLGEAKQGRPDGAA